MIPLWLCRRLALVLGLALPLAEIARRASALGQWWLWIDDCLIGAGLVLGWWLSREGSPRGLRALSAAWGIACGMGYYSFVGHALRMNQADVSGLGGWVITTVIGAGLLLALWCLASTIAARENSR